MANPKPLINGGPTDQVKQAGGESLFLTLAMAAGGQRVDSCIYATTRLMANICYSLKDIEQARAIVSQMALDAINELELNWPEREQLLADAKATIHREAGHG